MDSPTNLSPADLGQGALPAGLAEYEAYASLAFPAARHPSVIYCELGRTFYLEGQSRLSRGDAQNAQKRFGQAAQAFRDALRENPVSPDLNLFLAEARIAQERPVEALQAYNEALRLAPEHAADITPAMLDLLTPAVAAQLGDVGPRLAALLDMPGLDPVNVAALRLVAGWVSLLQEDTDRAANEFRQVLAAQPDNALAHEGLGRALGDAAAALASLALARDLLAQSLTPAAPSPAGVEASAGPSRPDADRRKPSLLPAMSRAADARRRTRSHLAATAQAMAELLAETKQHEQALSVALEALAMNELAPKDRVRLQALAAESRLALGQDEAALALAEDALALPEPEASTFDPFGLARLHAVAAAVFYGRGDHAASAEAAARSLDLDPDNLDAMRIRGLALLDAPDTRDEALELLATYVRRRPSDVHCLRRLLDELQKAERPPAEVAEVLQLMADHADPAERPPLLVRLARTLLALARPNEAAAAVEEALTLDPQLASADACLLHGAALRLAGQPGDALRSFAAGLELAPDDARLLQVHAETLQETGDLAAALAAWEKFLAHEPDSLQGHLESGRIALELQQTDRALSDLDRGLALAEQTAAPPEQIEEIQRLRGAALSQLARDDEAGVAWYAAGLSAYSRSNYGAAVDRLREAHRVRPMDRSTMWYLADALYMTSDAARPPFVDQARLDEALAVWDASATLALPDAATSWPYVTRARLSEQMAFLPGADARVLNWDAVLFLERALLLRSDDYFRWAYLGRTYRSLDAPFENTALAASDRATALKPDDAFVQSERAAILANMGRIEEGLAAIDRALALQPAPWMKAVKAYLLVYHGNLPEALELWDEVIDAEPQAIWYRFMRAFCYRRKGKDALARQDLKWVWDQRENALVSERFSLGFAAYQLGDYISAIGQFEELVKDRIAEPGTRAALGLAYLARGGSAAASGDDAAGAGAALQDFEAGSRNLARGYAINYSVRDLRDVQLFDLNELEKRTKGWPREAQVRERIGQARELVVARLKEIVDNPRTPEIELEEARNNADPEKRADRSLWVAATVSLARLWMEQGQYGRAFALYGELIDKHLALVPEAVFGAKPFVDWVEKQWSGPMVAKVDHLLRQGAAADALVELESMNRLLDILDPMRSFVRAPVRATSLSPEQREALRVAFTKLGAAFVDADRLAGLVRLGCESPLDTEELLRFLPSEALKTAALPRQQFILKARKGAAHFILGDSIAARGEFEAALSLGNTPRAGALLGKFCGDLFADSWRREALLADWRAWASAPESGEGLRSKLEAASDALMAAAPAPDVAASLG